MATAPPARGATHARPRPAATTAAAAGHRKPTQRAASASAAAAPRGSRQAAFLQLTCTIDEEVAVQQQRLDRIFADISVRCQDAAEAAGSGAAAPASAAASDERKEQPDSAAAAAAAAPSTAFHVPAQPFRFTTAAAVPAMHSQLSSSVAQLHSAVEQISHSEQQQRPPITFQLRPAAPAAPFAPVAAAAPPLVTAQLNLYVEEASPSPSPQPPLVAHPLPTVPPSAHRPATPLRASTEHGAASAVQIGSASGQVDVPVQPVAHPMPMHQGEQKDGHSAAAAPRSASASVLASFPALQRATDARTVAMQPPPATTPLDPFPSLSRALQMRQERLRNSQSNPQQAQLPSAAHPTAGAPAVATMRPLFSDAIHPAPTAAVSAAAFALPSSSSPSQPPVAAALSPAEADRLSVALLLKQQSLSLLCTQFQSRVHRLTRHRFLITWQWRLRLLRMTRTIERIQCAAALRLWRQRSRELMQQKHEAATKIQSVVRRRLAQKEFMPLQLSVHHHRRTLLAHLFSLWLSRYRRIRRWRHRWTSKLSVWGSALLLHRAWGSGAAFPARQWRSAEGTMRMAEEWAAWRQRRKVWGAWIQFMGRKRTDETRTKGPTKMVRIMQRH